MACSKRFFARSNPPTTPSTSPSASRTPFAGLLGAVAPSATPSNSPPSGDLLAPTMLPQAEDHLARMFAHLGPVAAAVLLTDVAPDAETASNGLLVARRAGEGVLPMPLVARLLAEHVPAETPVILLPGGVDAQRGALGL